MNASTVPLTLPPTIVQDFDRFHLESLHVSPSMPAIVCMMVHLAYVDRNSVSDVDLHMTQLTEMLLGVEGFSCRLRSPHETLTIYLPKRQNGENERPIQQ